MANISFSLKKIFQLTYLTFISTMIVFYVFLHNANTYIDDFILITSLLFFISIYFYLHHYFNKTFQLTNINDVSNRINEIKPFILKINALEREVATANTLIKAMEQGNLDLETTDSNSKESALYQSLVDMKNRMQQIANEEKQRNWATEGMANFGEILRTSNKDIQELSNAIIGKLVKYLGVNQGGIFILKGDTPHQYIELTACYAYHRKKFIEKRIEIGEGLIGQAVLEKESIYLTEVPNGYTMITSGLGEATPKCILITPLIANEEVYGVIEICAFEPLMQYQIDFVNKLGASIATTIAAVSIQENTNLLLKASQIQAAQLQSQEEEMRQNLEELHATQEDMQRKENEIKVLLEKSKDNEQQLKIQLLEINTFKEEERLKTEAMVREMELNKKIILKVIEELPDKIFLKDENGCLVLINSSLASGYNKPVEDLLGTSDFDNFPHDLASEYRAIELEMLKNGKPMTMYENFPDASGETKILYCVKMPFQFPGTDKLGILGYQVDVTEIKTLESKIKISEESMKKRESELLEKINEQMLTISLLKNQLDNN